MGGVKRASGIRVLPNLLSNYLQLYIKIDSFFVQVTTDCIYFSFVRNYIYLSSNVSYKMSQIHNLKYLKYFLWTSLQMKIVITVSSLHKAEGSFTFQTPDCRISLWTITTSLLLLLKIWYKSNIIIANIIDWRCYSMRFCLLLEGRGNWWPSSF